MSTTAIPDQFTTLPDEPALEATVVALEGHGFSVEVVGDLDAARQAVLARIPDGSSVMTNTSVTLAETGIADAINDAGGRWESARNKMFALDFATQAQQMKGIGGQPDYALGSAHAVTRDGTLVIASASGSQLASYAWGAGGRNFRDRRAEARPSTCPRRTSGSISTACRWRTPARRPLTGSTARSGRSWRSTRRCPAASTSSSSASRSASKLPSQPELPAATRRWPVTLDATPDGRELALAPLDEKTDHVRGSPAGHLIIEYGDYECPYSRQAFHAIEQVEQQLGGNMRFAFRHFPLTGIHPHALAAAAAAEAAALQGRFWDMHELLFHRQKALGDGDLRGYAAQLGLDVAAFDRDRASNEVVDRIRRDVDSGLASGQVVGTPTLFIDGVVYRGGYDPPTLLAALAP